MNTEQDTAAAPPGSQSERESLHQLIYGWKVFDPGTPRLPTITEMRAALHEHGWLYHCTDFADQAKQLEKAREALQGLLAQLEGPVMVYGDGIGNDGTKTGLSGEEFNALRESRINAARAALALCGKGEAVV